MSGEPGRPIPEQILAEIKAQEEPSRGGLRIWLGAASGVGKTYSMLQEGHRRKSRGTDVVIGLVETRERPEVKDLIGDLETVPPRMFQCDGRVVREMDTAAVIARHPKVALVDDLAHTNAAGSKHTKRYQDVQELLDAGVSVITTLSVQNIESLSEYVTQATGLVIPETVPDRIVDQADQVELIDIPPEVLRQRIEEGKVYPPSEARRVLEDVLTPGTLMTLRDLALRATAKEVEEKLDTYLQERKVEGLAVGERIMVALGCGPGGELLIRRAWRLAAATKGDLIVVHVEPADDRGDENGDVRRRPEENLRLAEDLGARVVRLDGKPTDELARYARANHVSHLFIGHPTRGRWGGLFRGSVTNNLLRAMPGMQVHVIAATRTLAGKESG